MTGSQGAPRVLVVTNMWPAPDAPARGIFVQEQVEDVQRLAPSWSWDHLVIDGRKGRREYLRGIFQVRRRVGAGLDLIHAHYGLTGAAAAFQRRTPLVVTYHGSDLYIPWQRRLSAFAARRAAATIAVSDRLGSMLPGGVSHTVPCGVDLERFRPGDRAAARAALGLPPEASVVVFPGDPSRTVKGYPLFREALAALPAELRERTIELHLTGLTHAQVPQRLQAADAVLLTSTYEGAGNVAKEAVACGVPVVSTAVGDVPHVIGGLPGCAVVDRDPESLARALRSALRPRDPWDGRDRLRQLGVDRDTVAGRVLDVYRETLEGRGSDGRGA